MLLGDQQPVDADGLHLGDLGLWVGVGVLHVPDDWDHVRFDEPSDGVHDGLLGIVQFPHHGPPGIDLTPPMYL